MAFQLTVTQSPTAAEIQRIADDIQGSSAKVVVVFATEGQVLELFSEVGRLNLLKTGGFIFLNKKKQHFFFYSLLTET